MQRAAFENSGASFHARVIERRSLEQGRAYWQSFDFGDEARGTAVFAHPLDFVAEQTEVIFPLPNGLSGFFLAGSDGQRLEASSLPRTAVLDPAQRDGVLRSPASCFTCHDQGLIHFSDAMHDTWLPVAENTGERHQVLELYPPDEALYASIEAENQALASARTALGIIGPANVSRLAMLFTGKVDRDRAMEELLTTQEALASTATRLPGPLFPFVISEGEVSRSEFGAAYRDAMCTLHATSQNRPAACP